MHQKTKNIDVKKRLVLRGVFFTIFLDFSMDLSTQKSRIVDQFVPKTLKCQICKHCAPAQAGALKLRIRSLKNQQNFEKKSIQT